MRRDRDQGLEGRVSGQTRLPKRQGLLRRTIGYLAPFLSRYDPVREAEKLLKEDAAVADHARETGMTTADVAGHLQAAYLEHRTLWTYARLADTSDRSMGLACNALQAVTSFLGCAVVIEGEVEQALEMVPKLPFLNYLRKDPLNAHHLTKLLMVEAATFFPGVGIVDEVTNLYMSTAREAIRAHGAARVLGAGTPLSERILYDRLPDVTGGYRGPSGMPHA